MINGPRPNILLWVISEHRGINVTLLARQRCWQLVGTLRSLEKLAHDGMITSMGNGFQPTKRGWRRLSVALALALATLVNVFALSTARAEPNSNAAGHVLHACRDFANPRTPPDYDQGLCIGKVQVLFYFGQMYFGICTPRGATVGQSNRVIIRYIEERPARHHEDFRDLALEALRAAWPCKGGVR
jgi:hypothetical protein